ncbi:hypothetical protein NQ318_008827 [Aromia moschata]|uniref:Uncharacterized protein n=1 Tax=Aromia moschata TaxID=1265417 RepID=A0AAV8ZC27_9CUCU|nr:hypothetical protein NQ318_008827 [Aromia moschata]
MYWDRLIITDRTVDFNRPDIVLINKEQRRGIIIDIAVPLTHNIQKTEREKIAKYENLSIERKCLWKLEKVETYALVISAEGVLTTRFAKNIAALGLSYNIIPNGQKAVIPKDYLMKHNGNHLQVNNYSLCTTPQQNVLDLRTLPRESMRSRIL